MIAIHTAEGGETELSVNPKYNSATELFTYRTFDIRDGKFTYQFSTPDTALFKLE